MLGKIGALGILAVLAFTAGCTMCCHPYDECGPVFDGSSGHSYCSNARAGSILDGGNASVPTNAAEEAVEEASPTPNAAQQGYTSAESEPRVLSVTDRKVGETAAVAETLPTRRPSRQAGDYYAPTTRRR